MNCPGRFSDRMLFLILTNGSVHNFELDDDVSDLSLELSSRLDVLPFGIDVMSMPDVETAIDAFMDVEEAFELYAKPSGSQNEG